MTKPELAAELQGVAQEMIDLGAKMDYYAGFDRETAIHGGELIGAGMIAATMGRGDRKMRPIRLHNMDIITGSAVVPMVRGSKIMGALRGADNQASKGSKAGG